jgi:N-methylhydantoinase B
MKPMTPIELEVFKNLFASICEEMGVVLARSSFSTNIKERKDFSCALFNPRAQLVAQAAHIPVHLGSMPLSVKSAASAFSLKPGDVVILNDPYRGGTHLPDITLVSPAFVERQNKPTFYVANRAHHADVGGKSPGSMPLATHLEEEGVVIPPTLFQKRGTLNQQFLKMFLQQVRRPDERRADLRAQVSANELGIKRLKELVSHYGLSKIQQAMREYRRYEERITLQAIRQIPKGTYSFEDYLDDDGLSHDPVKIGVKIKVQTQKIEVDFSPSQNQVRGPVNATYAITLSAVAYVFRSLVLSLTGEDCLSLTPITVRTRKGSIVDATYPAPVAGGNVETSQRIVDVLLGALSTALPQIIPAASQGTMNNIAMGSENFTYYETLAGGAGATSAQKGTDAIHTHMTNTLNTPIEALESTLPIRVTEYRIRQGSGGLGHYHGGNGLVREYEFLENTEVSILSDRRKTKPWGLAGGKSGKPGANWRVTSEKKKKLPGKVELKVKKGDRIRIETPGGGGWGR